MNISELKNNFYNLIVILNDAEVLKEFYDGLILTTENKLQTELSEKKKQEILLAYEESEDENNLIDDEIVREKYKKYL